METSVLFSMTEEPAECRAFLGRAAGANRKMCCRVGCRSRGSPSGARARARGPAARNSAHDAEFISAAEGDRTAAA